MTLTKRRIFRYCADIAFGIAVFVIGRWIMEYNGYPDIQWPSYILGAIMGAISVQK